MQQFLIEALVVSLIGGAIVWCVFGLGAAWLVGFLPLNAHCLHPVPGDPGIRFHFAIGRFSDFCPHARRAIWIPSLRCTRSDAVTVNVFNARRAAALVPRYRVAVVALLSGCYSTASRGGKTPEDADAWDFQEPPPQPPRWKENGEEFRFALAHDLIGRRSGQPWHHRHRERLKQAERTSSSKGMPCCESSAHTGIRPDMPTATRERGISPNPPRRSA